MTTFLLHFTNRESAAHGPFFEVHFDDEVTQPTRDLVMSLSLRTVISPHFHSVMKLYKDAPIDQYLRTRIESAVATRDRADHARGRDLR